MVQIVDFGAGFWALDFGSWILDFGLLSVIQQFFLCRFWTLDFGFGTKFWMLHYIR